MGRSDTTLAPPVGLRHDSAVQTVRAEIDEDRGLALVRVTTAVTPRELLDVVTEDPRFLRMPRHLWIIGDGVLAALTTDDIAGLARAFRPAWQRPGGRTAFVASDPAMFGLARMYGAHAEMEGSHAAYGVFRTEAEAREWLFGTAD
jgi:hypothetical protein